MKLTTTAHDLRAALAAVKPAIEPRNTIPVLGTVLFDGKRVAATDLDMTIETQVAATAASGSACVSYRPLATLIRSLPADETVTIEAKGATTTIRFSSGIYRLPSLPAADFPDEKPFDAEAEAVDGEAFARALRFVAPFISAEETRYYLNGACLSVDGDGRSGAVTTDGHRLGFFPVEYPAAWRGIIIPRGTVAALLALPPARTITVAGTRARFDCGSIVVTTKLIDGTFPEWLRVVPKIEVDAPTTTLDVVESVAVLRRIGMVGRCRGIPVTVAADARGVIAQIGGKHSDAQAVERLVKARCDAVKPTITSFNPVYMRDALGVFRGTERVTLWPDATGPTVIRQGDSAAFTMLMPMRGGEDDLAIAALKEWATEAASFREAAE